MIEFFSFCVGKTTVIDCQLTAENPLKTSSQLSRQGYLRYQIEYILPCRQLLLNQMNIDIRLAGGSNAMQQYDLLTGGPEMLDFIGTFLLRSGQRMHRFNRSGIGSDMRSSAFRGIQETFV